ncbi:hypothetical protein [Vibrio crassostreae]|uniref:hypothetical protein n=1 Tax=Vibrio crassostreae TaxID=246167 RepID=UPI001B3022AC|nr:hypothetical protein [Vibrio crassostreae]
MKFKGQISLCAILVISGCSITLTKSHEDKSATNFGRIKGTEICFVNDSVSGETSNAIVRTKISCAAVSDRVSVVDESHRALFDGVVIVEGGNEGFVLTSIEDFDLLSFEGIFYNRETGACQYVDSAESSLNREVDC